MVSVAPKILIGVSGRTDSLVAAYLLKKQGYEVHAVAVVFNRLGDSEAGKGVGNALPAQLVQYAISDLQQIKNSTEQLEIPFYAVNAQERYYAEVHDHVVAHRLTGRFYNSKLATTSLLLQLLYEKAKELKIEAIATGHFAKFNRNSKTGENALFACPDRASDQSFILAATPPEILKILFLPLADMRKVDVQKVSKIMSAKGLASERHSNLFEKMALGKLLTPFIPPSLVKEGEIINRFDGSVLNNHKGIHHYFLGQSALGAGFDDAATVTGIDGSTAAIYVDAGKRLSFSHLYLKNCVFSSTIEKTKPLDVFVQFDENSKRQKGKLFFKNNSSCVIAFEENSTGFIARGSPIVVYAKADGISRVLLSGLAHECFHVDGAHARRFPPMDEMREEEQTHPAIKDQMGF